MAALQGGRVLVGAALVVAPSSAGGSWIGSPARQSGGRVALRALGVRDLMLGLGALRAARRGDAAEVIAWSLGLAACDLVDGIATAAAAEELPGRGGPVMAMAFGAAAAGVAIAATLR
ncbi:unannotated protein [freshwater metagenome]|uniref:Unannotated protein n=1 Tax=freshwater metagenome TaxID=449393 RepID=A0A6J7CFQ9_9ZZZZ|nr:hypothetical protein [Actinomycetota bacterium]